MSEVEYRELEDFPGYRIGSDGSVWSQWQRGRWKRRLATWRSLRLPRENRGYLQVNLYQPLSGKRVHFKVHRLVMLAFVGPLPAGKMIRHLDGDRTNNTLDNLAYGTAQENALDTLSHGRVPRGETHSSAKLTDDDVVSILRSLRDGRPQFLVAADHGVSRPTICDIVKGRTWTHIRRAV